MAIKHAICETCHRIVHSTDVDAEGNCVICHNTPGRPTEAEWVDLGRPTEPEEKQ